MFREELDKTVWEEEAEDNIPDWSQIFRLTLLEESGIRDGKVLGKGIPRISDVKNEIKSGLLINKTDCKIRKMQLLVK